MSTKKSNLVLGGIITTLAIILIPLFTLWFGTLQNPFNYTLSMIGNRFDKMTEFIIWGVITGALLVFFILYLHRKASYKDKRSRRLLIYSHIFLVLTCITPAIEEINPFFHRLHALFGALFGVSLSLSLFFFIKYLNNEDEIVFGKSMLFFKVIVLGSLALLIVFGNCGVFELFFFLTLSAFLFLLKKWLKKY